MMTIGSGNPTYLKISFWLPDGIQLDNDQKCTVEMKNLDEIELRVIAKCLTSCPQTDVKHNVIIPHIVDIHSQSWHPNVNLPSIVVSNLFLFVSQIIP